MVRHPGFYNDLNKRSTDLLTKDFPCEKPENKFSYKGITQENVEVEASITQKGNGTFLGVFAPKYHYRDWKTTFSGELNTKKEAKAEVAVDDVLNLEGVKATFTVQTLSGAKATDPQQSFGTIALEYKHEHATVQSSVDIGKPEGPSAKTSAVIRYGNLIGEGFYLGASTLYHIGTSELKELKTTAGYKARDFDITLFGKVLNGEGKSHNEVGVNYYHDISALLGVGSELTFDLNNTSKPPTCAFVSRYSFSKDTFAKAKLDTEGRVGISVAQKLQGCRIVGSGTFDFTKLGEKNSSAVGFTFSF